MIQRIGIRLSADCNASLPPDHMTCARDEESRERVWESYDRAVKASKARAKTRAETELELAVQDDAKSKADAWILTKQVIDAVDASLRDRLLVIAHSIPTSLVAIVSNFGHKLA